MTRPDRFTLAWWAVLCAVAVALCFTPLFDLLGFEFAFAMSIPATLYAGHCGVRARRAATLRAGRAWAVATRRGLAGLVGPLAIITANALRVQNCDYLEGLAFYALIAGVGVIVAAGWGVAVARIFPRRGYPLFVLGVVATVVAAGLRFWLEPPVDLFHPFFGYWPGALYDDVLYIDDRLLWSRFEDLALVAAAVAGSSLPASLRATLRPRPALLAAAAIGLAAFARAGATAHAVHRDAAYIAEALGGLTETERLRIIHPARYSPADVWTITAELEFAYDELRAFFALDITRPVTVWIYPDDATKKRLMGARRVRIAKPWQWAFHVHAPTVGQSVLVHEMAHVFSAEITDPPHHLSLYRGLVPHMPLIEGLAEAATWKTDRLDLHQWSAAMHRIGVAPPLEELLAPADFYRHNARTAYTLCGSFARYYRDRHGADALADAYRRGAFDAPDRPLGPLVDEWRQFLTTQPLADAALAYAEARFDRPSIFGRACAHEIAGLRRAARDATPHDALALTERILKHQPGDISARLTRVGLLAALDRWPDARAQAEQLADDPRAGAVARAAAREWVADLAALTDDLDTARALYAEVTEAAFERSDLRRLAVKRAALDQGDAGRRVLDYLTAPPREPESRRALLDAVVAEAPDWAPARYLRGRARLSAAQDDPIERAAALDNLVASAGGLTDPSLRFELAQMIADTAFYAGCHALAAARFTRLAERDDLALTRGERLDLATWSRRATFFGAWATDHPPPTPAVCADIDNAATALDDAARSAE